MTDEQDAPVASGARERRTGASSGVEALKAMREADTREKAERKQQRQQKVDAGKESSVRAAKNAGASIRKHKWAWIISGAVVVVLAAIAVVEYVSATSGDPRDMVEAYVDAMNSGDAAAFENPELFVVSKDAPLAPPEVLATLDTTLVDPKISLSEKDSVMKATIQATNLEAPIVLTLQNEISLEGVLLKPHWSVVSKLATMSIAAAPELPADASFAIGDYSLGTASTEPFVSLAGKSFSVPVGRTTLATSATATTEAATEEVVVGVDDSQLMFGGSIVYSTNCPSGGATAPAPTEEQLKALKAAFRSGNFDPIKSQLCNPVKWIIANSDGWGEMTPDEALEFLADSTQAARSWDFDVNEATRSQWDAAQGGILNSDYFGPTAFIAVGDDDTAISLRFDANVIVGMLRFMPSILSASPGG